MELKFQLLDCDYFLNNNRPVVRMFGKTKSGKTVCAFYEGMKPYFYVSLKELESDKKDVKKELIEFLQKNFADVFESAKVVYKILPIGYREKKSKLIKIVLTNPAKTPAVREEIRKIPFVNGIYEADILFKYRFMVDHGLYGMGSVKVDAVPAQTKTVKTNYRLNAKKVEPIDEDIAPELKYMSLDIEVASTTEGLPDARKNPVSMISMSFYPKYKKSNSMVLLVKKIKNNGDKTVVTFNSEKEMLEKFLRILDEFDPDIVIGYNINGFDLPYLIERFRQNKMQPLLGRCSTKPATSRKFGMWNRSDIVGRVVVDSYELIKELASKGLMRLKRFGLGDVSRALLDEDKVDIAHSEIVKYWNGDSKKIEKLIEYSRKDSILALKLVLEKDLLGKFIELSKVSGVLLQDALSSGEATRVETLLLREFNSAGFVIPCKPRDEEVTRRNVERETKALKGALVLEPDIGLHTNCVVYLDFKSMYPSIYISYNICPTTLILDKSPQLDESKIITTPYGAKFVAKTVKKGIIPQIVEKLITERDLVKKEMKSEKNEERRKQLNSKQLALKIMANAFYGYTGYVRAKVYILDIANAITSCGRFLIQKTRDTVEKDKRFKVIYGDTDSVMVKTETKDIDKAFEIGKELEEKINKELEGIVKMKIESIFKSIIILTKKRYAGWSFEKIGDKWEDKIIMKGIETVRRDWCDLVSDTLYKVLEIVLKEQNPKKAFEYVRSVLDKLKKNEVPIEKLIITKSISKPIRSYKGVQPHVELVKKMRKRSPTEAPGVGDRVGFVIIHGMQMLSRRAEDPEYVKRQGLRIDSKYYIESQLLPPLERVFDAMGVDRSELLGMGKQTLLTSIINKKRDERTSKNLEPKLDSADGVICQKCEKNYRRPPLIGKCSLCGGKLLFYKGGKRSTQVLA